MKENRSTGTSRFLRTAGLKISAPLGALASLTTIVIMVVVTIDVIARNLGGSSVPGLLEMSESALVATVFLGIAYTGATNGHVAVDLVTEKLHPTVARKLAGVVWLVSSAMVAWFLYSSVLRAVDSTAMGEVSRGLIEWHIWPSRWFLVIGYAAFLIVALINSYLSFRNEPLLGEDDEDLESTDNQVDATPNDDSDANDQGMHADRKEVRA